MAKKLFGMGWQRQTKEGMRLLHNANIRVDFIGVDESDVNSLVLASLAGKDAILPVLFVDGVKYGGLDGIRRYIAQS